MKIQSLVTRYVDTDKAEGDASVALDKFNAERADTIAKLDQDQQVKVGAETDATKAKVDAAVALTAVMANPKILEPGQPLKFGTPGPDGGQPVLILRDGKIVKTTIADPDQIDVPGDTPTPTPEPMPGPTPVPNPLPNPLPGESPLPLPLPLPLPFPGPGPIVEPGPGPFPIPGPILGPIPAPGEFHGTPTPPSTAPRDPFAGTDLGTGPTAERPTPLRPPGS